MAELETSSSVDSLPSADPQRAMFAREDPSSLYALAAGLVVAAASWFLLKELGPLLRPLVLAVFLTYLIVPFQQWLRRHIPAIAAGAVIVGGTLVLFWGLVMMVYGNAVELNDDLPRLLERGRSIAKTVMTYGRAHLPEGMLAGTPGSADAEARVWISVRGSMRAMVSNGATLLGEAFVVGVYLAFLLVDLRRFPRRIRAGFSPERAEAILGIIARINSATTRYLRAKTLTSLATAIPTFAVLWSLGVPYPVMWGVLTFFGNFIPYVGGLVAFVPPVMLAFLELDPLWRPLAVTLLLVLIQVVTNNFVEPTLTGKAVNLSPLVTVIAVAFWGLCWGLTGMLLAVPLTAMLKIVWENVAFARPLAVLMAEEDG